MEYLVVLTVGESRPYYIHTSTVLVVIPGSTGIVEVSDAGTNPPEWKVVLAGTFSCVQS